MVKYWAARKHTAAKEPHQAPRGERGAGSPLRGTVRIGLLALGGKGNEGLQDTHRHNSTQASHRPAHPSISGQQARSPKEQNRRPHVGAGAGGGGLPDQTIWFSLAQKYSSRGWGYFSKIEAYEPPAHKTAFWPRTCMDELLPVISGDSTAALTIPENHSCFPLPQQYSNDPPYKFSG